MVTKRDLNRLIEIMHEKLNFIRDEQGGQEILYEKIEALRAQYEKDLTFMHLTQDQLTSLHLFFTGATAYAIMCGPEFQADRFNAYIDKQLKEVRKLSTPIPEMRELITDYLQILKVRNFASAKENVLAQRDHKEKIFRTLRADRDHLIIHSVLNGATAYTLIFEEKNEEETKWFMHDFLEESGFID